MTKLQRGLDLMKHRVWGDILLRPTTDALTRLHCTLSTAIMGLYCTMASACIRYAFCSYPCFENPYAMDIHDSPVTACAYFADCSPDLIGAYSLVGSRTQRTGYSDKV